MKTGIFERLLDENAPVVIPGIILSDGKEPEDFSVELNDRASVQLKFLAADTVEGVRPERYRKGFENLRERLLKKGNTEAPITLAGFQEPFGWDGITTTPALLAISALRVGYEGWSQRFFHDYYSGIAARHHLAEISIGEDIPLPGEIIDLIVRVIQFQNAYRNLFHHPEDHIETGIWDPDAPGDRRLSFEKDTTLPIFWSQFQAPIPNPLKKPARIVLSACAVALQGESDQVPKESLLKKCAMLAAGASIHYDSEAAPAGRKKCVHFEYGNYTFVHNKNLKDLVTEKVDNRPDQCLNTSMEFFSLGRRSSNIEQENFTKMLREELGKPETPIGFIKSTLLRDRAGEDLAYYELNIPPRIEFQIYFGNGAEAPAEDESAWMWIERAIEALRSKKRQWGFGNDEFVPYPLVDRAIRGVHRIFQGHPGSIQSKEFFTVRLICGEPGSPGSEQILYLPKEAPEEDDLTAFASEGSWSEPKLLTARYVAAAIVNVRMARGVDTVQVIFETDGRMDEKVETGWLKVIDWVDRRNFHWILQRYLEQIGSPSETSLGEFPFGKLESSYGDLIGYEKRPDPNSEEKPGRGLTIAAGKPNLILCLDIGATGIKANLYEFKDDQLQQQSKLKEAISIPTDPGADQWYASGEHFAQVVIRRLEDKLEGTIEWNQLIAVAATWPGAVRGKPGREYVTGTSRILEYFRELSAVITENRAADIHNLRIREGLKTVFEEAAGHGLYVRLMNDSVGHGEATQTKFKGSFDNSKQTVAITPGTGLALGVLGSPEFLCELGKFTFNLAAAFPDEETGTFPAGVANGFMNSKTIASLAKDITLVRDETFRDFLVDDAPDWPPAPIEELTFSEFELGFILAKMLNRSSAEEFFEAEELFEEAGQEWLESLTRSEHLWLLDAQLDPFPVYNELWELSKEIELIGDSKQTRKIARNLERSEQSFSKIRGIENDLSDSQTDPAPDAQSHPKSNLERMNGQMENIASEIQRIEKHLSNSQLTFEGAEELKRTITRLKSSLNEFQKPIETSPSWFTGVEDRGRRSEKVRQILERREIYLKRTFDSFPHIKPGSELSESFDRFGEKFGKKTSDLKPEERFAVIVAYRLGCLLADLAATCVDLFDADSLAATGGPLSGATGEVVRFFAQHELRAMYGFQVQVRKDSGKEYAHPVRILYFPTSPADEATADAISRSELAKLDAPWGAGLATGRFLVDRVREDQIKRLENLIRATSQSQDSLIIVSALVESGEFRLLDESDVREHLLQNRTRLNLIPTGEMGNFLRMAASDPILKNPFAGQQTAADQ